MPAPTTNEILGFSVEVNPQDAIKSIDRFQREMSKRMKAVEKGNKNLDKGIGKFVHQLVGAKRVWSPMLKDVNKQYKLLQSSVLKYDRTITSLQRKAAQSQGAELTRLEGLIKKAKSLRDAKAGALGKSADMKETLESKVKFDSRELLDSMREAGQELAEPFRAILAKDIPGAFGAAGKLAGKAIEGSFKGLGKLSSKAGSKLGAKGSDLVRKGGAKGGGVGAGMQGLGGIMKGFGGLMKSLGPLLGMVGKLGPALGAVSGAVVGIIKLFLDAEAAAKDFNEQILATVGSSQFLAANMNNVKVGAYDLESTLKDVYDQATDLSNVNWGITKEQHQAVLGSLTAEGVSLKRLQSDFEATAEGAKDAAGHAKNFGTTVQMSVAYSRLLGVSLNEISNFQAEMMTEMGMSLKTVQLQFAGMTRAAEESGIASNKFFAIIRSVSADLSLYNTRMEDAVHMLTMLGKVMSPRNAQKFLQSSMQSIKNMGRTERLKVALLSGGKAKEAVDRDVVRKTKSLAEQIAEKTGIGVDQISKAISGGDAVGFDKIIKGLPGEEKGALKEAFIEIGLQKQRASKGVYGVGIAAGETGPAAQLQIMQSALAKWGGGSTLRAGAGSLGMEAMSDNLGISIEQLNSMIKFEAAMDDQRAILKDGFKNNDQAVTKKLSKVLGRDIKNSADIDKLGYDQLMDTLDEDAKKQLTDSGKQINYAEQTAGFQTSFMKKLDILMDFLMNRLYAVMSGIWDVVLDVVDLMDVTNKFGIGDAKQQKRMQDLIMKSKDENLRKAFDESGGDAYKTKGKLMETTGAGLLQALDDRNKEYAELVKKQAEGGGTEAEKKKIADRIQQLTSDKDAIAGKITGGTNMNQQENALQFMLEGRKGEDRDRIGHGVAQMQIARSKGENISAFEALNRGGVKLSPAEANELLGKMLWAMDPEKLFSALPEANRIAGGIPAQPTPAAAAAAAGTPAQAGSPPAQAAPQGAAAPKAPAVVVKDGPTEAQQQDMIKSTDDVQKALRKQGIKMDKTFLEGPYAKTTEGSVLEAVRQALFEYWVLTQTKAWGQEFDKQGIKTGREAMAAVSDWAFQPGKLAGVGNAVGGTVSSISGNMANVTRFPPAAPGEGWASVGPGEKILPAGAGGGGGGSTKVVLELKGDMLKQIIRATAIEEYGNSKRNERLR